MIRHAGLVACRIDGLWRGALIEGASGAGKSDLALRAVGEGLCLVADDRVVVWASGGHAYGRAPDPLGGLLEVRGLGVMATRHIAYSRIVLVVSDGPTERMPEPAQADVAGVAVGRILLPLLEPSAPAKLRRALHHLGTRL